jgi:hypothetical protein
VLLSQPLVKEELANLELFPLVLAKTQCPIYISDESKSYKQRIGYFYRVSKIRDHVENIHLKGVNPEKTFSYYYPVYKSQGLVLKYLQYFKNYVQTVYSISLRE